MRNLIAAGLLISVSGIFLGQSSIENSVQTQLTHLFPAASVFSPKEGTPPHFKVYRVDAESGKRVLMGFAFWTTEIEPLERGYDGPIKILVGVDIDGVLTGIVVVDHHEPSGYFSIDRPQFASQFVQKTIRDPFRVGSDVDAISTATLTVTSATRAIRNSARRIAKQFLTPPESR